MLTDGKMVYRKSWKFDPTARHGLRPKGRQSGKWGAKARTYGDTTKPRHPEQMLLVCQPYHGTSQTTLSGTGKADTELGGQSDVYCGIAVDHVDIAYQSTLRQGKQRNLDLSAPLNISSD